MEKIAVPKNALSQMYLWQKELIESYKVIEGLPEYPLDLGVKSNQLLMKDFISRYLVELMESYEAIRNTLRFAISGDIMSAKDCCIEFSEEVADAQHFLLELLIYSGVEEQDIKRFLKSYQENYNVGMYTENTLLSLLNLGQMHNLQDGTTSDNIKNPHTLFTVSSDMEMVEDPRLSALNRINSDLVGVIDSLLWGCTFFALQAQNCLKSKKWKRGEFSEAEIIQQTLNYRESLFNMLIIFYRYVNAVGMNAQGLYLAYKNKNEINQKRIKDGY